MRKVDARKPLFDLNKPTQTQPEKKKRGRPKKSVTEVVVKKEEVTATKHTQPKKEKEVVWQDYNKTKPETYVPCEFCVKTDKGEELFNGYISLDRHLCTNEPYKAIVLRNRFGNMYYRQINGCSDVRLCPGEFPNCKNCKKK